MNRMLGTPTFLTGACFVLVATLAYGTTQTHLLYSDPGCQAANCSAAQPNGSGGGGVPLKTNARPGVGSQHGPAHGGAQTRLPEGTPARPGGGSQASHPASSHSGQPSHQPAPPPVAQHNGKPGPRVAILFHTENRFHGGFMGAITIVNHGRTTLDGWQLWLRYRTTEIDHMWGAHWFPDSAQARNAGMAAALANENIKPGGTDRFTFRASGAPAAPVGCSFDGYRCSVKALAGTGKVSGGRHGHHPGGHPKPGTGKH